ncbi:MAG: hypothetical protein EOP61_01875 [Sphingomonadales bacterium]|nr:MAG: hypothetical protein EOP61_01875 [Sphingomonadales bacterium]
MVTMKRSSLRLLTIAIGLLFTAGIYYSMHYRIPWEWNAPGIGKLPQEIVRGYLAEAYDRGQGAKAARDYFAPQVVDNAPEAQDRRDGAPMPHEIRTMFGQGAQVVVIHRIGATRGQPVTDVIDVFETKGARITRRERFPTRFTPS